MKRLGMLAATAALALALPIAVAGCTTSGRDNAADSRFVGEWVLVTATDAAGPLALTGTYITLTINPNAAATGRGPCNDYKASVIGQPGAVFVNVTDQSLGPCSDTSLVTLDERYIRDLTSSSVARLDTDYLTFSSRESTLRFHRVVHFMIGAVLDIPWVATTETFRDHRGNTYSATPAGMLMLSRNNTFSVHVGACPTITGTWHMNAGEIVLAGLHGIDDACFTPDDSENRSSMMNTLANGFRTSTADGELTTTNPRTRTDLAFQREELD